MRVLLFDPESSGHHLEYAGHITRYLTSKGDDVLFATWAKPLPSQLADEDQEMAGGILYLGGTRSPSQDKAKFPITTAKSVHRAMQLARRRQVDVVHFLYLDRSELALLASLSFRAPGPAIFGTLFWPYFVHDPQETVGVGKRLFHAASERALRRLLERRMMDGVFVHSERIKLLLARRFPDTDLADRLFLAPDPAKQAPAISVGDARAHLRLPSGVPMILFFGRARPDKGPDVLLQALPMLRGDWLAVLAGPPGVVGEADAEACRKLLDRPDRLVTRFEYIPEGDADHYFRAADVVVLPYSKTFKGTSGVLRRAAASGKPVIATDVGDVGHDVRDAGLGEVIPADSPAALASALQDFLAGSDQIATEVEPRALQYARTNDWRILGRATRTRYVQALESRRYTRLHP